MKAMNHKHAFLAGTASFLMMTGCSQSGSTRTAQNTDDQSYRTASTQYERASDIPDTRNDRQLPGVYATPLDDADKSAQTLNDSKKAVLVGDGEVLGMLNAIDKHEMHATGEAMTKDLSPAVKDFSQMLHKDHGASLEKSQQVAKELGITIASPAQGQTLMNDGKTKVTEMSRLTGEEFERAYMLAMVQGHIDALRAIDDEMLPVAKDNAVITHLKATREVIAEHLKQAQKIHGDLNKPYEGKNPAERSPL